jgi:hypothetical protein
MSAPVPAAEVSHFMDTFSDALTRGPVRTISAQPLNDRGGSAGMHGCEPMERHMAELARLRAAEQPASLVEALLQTCFAWPDHAEGDRWRAIISAADTGPGAIAMLAGLRNSITKGANQ